MAVVTDELLEGSRTDVSDWVTPISMLRDAFFDCRSEVERVSQESTALNVPIWWYRHGSLSLKS
jgi:hypothetical protein